MTLRIRHVASQRKIINAKGQPEHVETTVNPDGDAANYSEYRMFASWLKGKGYGNDLCQLIDKDGNVVKELQVKGQDPSGSFNLFPAASSGERYSTDVWAEWDVDITTFATFKIRFACSGAFNGGYHITSQENGTSYHSNLNGHGLHEVEFSFVVENV